ncbi:hypothetical protein [Paracoccus fontiphilus]|uniref:O-Antigen ligase n=1 Tax=Paracoccus fontiphilus TaxID=1815556 RepID=A0ABV7IF14_9RHOB|nr:hypothetical protein [Paracoccus fontiphilus]
MAVLSWPFVVFWLLANRTPATAVTWAIIGAYLLLPSNFSLELPAVPSLDKASIPALCTVLAAAMLIKEPRLRQLAPGMILSGALPRSRAVRILLAMMVVGTVGTVLTNGNALYYGHRVLPGMRPYDLASTLGGLLFALLPFFLGRKYLAHPEAQRSLLVGLAMAGLLYTLPALYEVRMSPQISRMIYGYFPHDWAQHIRAGGFRPVVFLHHGLWLAIFFCCAFMAALSMWRSGTGVMRTRWLGAAVWLFMTLVLSKGVGALGIGLLLGAVILFVPLRLQVLLAAGFAACVLVYPMLRGAGLVPTDMVVRLSERVDTERAGSLLYRLDNEDILLEKANQRPMFGWGTWGRNRIFDAQGQDISVTDGYWVMSIGMGGWIGYLAEFGLLTIPLIFMALRWRILELTPATAGLALAMTANLIDLIPNATLTPVTWLLAGALAGRLELGRVAEKKDMPAIVLPGRISYTRQTQRHPAGLTVR